MRRWRAASGLVGAAAMLAVVTGLPGPAVGDDSGGRVDLLVAVRVDDRCGRFADALPPLVVASSLGPDATTAPVEVCVTTRGRARGPLTLAASELVDEETGCTGDEPAVDATCGGIGAGELAGALTTRVERAAACSNGKPASYAAVAGEPSLAALASTPSAVGPEPPPNAAACLRLRLRSAPPGGFAASQSDRVRWRYVFTVGS